jgi:hypothetical protein
MELEYYFDDFLAEIRLTQPQIDELKSGHETLTKRLHEFEPLKASIVTSFLQGSYRRATIIRPHNNKRSDVDIVVVTRIPSETSKPAAAIDHFIPFVDKYYKGKYVRQGRSLGIKLDSVEMDLVITAAPSEAQQGLLMSESVRSLESLEDDSSWRMVESFVPREKRNEITFAKMLAEEEWKSEPLLIPDCEANKWVPTHPLEQIRWTREKNSKCNGHFVNVVKAIKWWQRTHPTVEKPKGYPLERIIAECCPDGINYVSEGVVKTLEAIVNKYGAFVLAGQVPDLKDHGTGQPVLKRLTGTEFAAFYGAVQPAALLARKAFDCQDKVESIKLWRQLFGDKFPAPPEDAGPGGKGGFVKPKAPAAGNQSGRFG